jgi:hypothetical protein
MSGAALNFLDSQLTFASESSFAGQVQFLNPYLPIQAYLLVQEMLRSLV